MKSRTKRVYDIPITPYARVMASPHVSQERKALLRAQHVALNPVALSRQEFIVRKKIDQALKRLRQRLDASYLLQLPPVEPSLFVELNNVQIFRISLTPKLPCTKFVHNFRGHHL